jgi:hypothetical protein
MKTRLHIILFAISLVSGLPVAPAAAGDASAADPLQSSLLWALLPGGGHFYLDEPAEGTAYAATIVPLIGAGAWLNGRNGDLGRQDEANTFWLLAMKEWELSFFTTYRNALRAENRDLRRRGIDDTPLPELFAAPFRMEQLSDPLVILAGLLGVAAGAYDARHSNNSMRDIERVGMFGDDANRDWGTALYGLDAAGISLAAGVSEEAFWRGMLQNELEMTFGKGVGLCSAAALFGAAHIVDIDWHVRGERVAVATTAGLYLGFMFQKNGHRLSKPIAAHFWYNFTAMMTAFALDPENNPLGMQVSFRF